MANGENCLSIAVDLAQWKRMTEDERIEQTFYCLRYLVGQAQQKRFVERCLTVVGAITANLVVLVPVIWWIIDHANK
jgi:hypothetical protein